MDVKAAFCLAAVLTCLAGASSAAQGNGGWTLFPACAPYAKPTDRPTPEELAVADRLVNAFERSYPKALAGEASVERTPLGSDALARLVADLACVSSHPGADPFVPEQALALFASKRHGRAAFAALNALARSEAASPALRSAARAFERQMRSYVSNSRRGNG